MVYVKDEKGQLFTLKEIAEKYEIPLKLVQSRYTYGLRKIEDLIQPKYEMLRK